MENYLLSLYKDQVVEKMSAYSTLEEGLSTAKELVAEHGMTLTEQNVQLLTEWWNEINPTADTTVDTVDEEVSKVITKEIVSTDGNTTIYNIYLPEAPDTRHLGLYAAEEVLIAWTKAIKKFVVKIK